MGGNLEPLDEDLHGLPCVLLGLVARIKMLPPAPWHAARGPVWRKGPLAVQRPHLQLIIPVSPSGRPCPSAFVQLLLSAGRGSPGGALALGVLAELVGSLCRPPFLGRGQRSAASGAYCVVPSFLGLKVSSAVANDSRDPPGPQSEGA